MYGDDFYKPFEGHRLMIFFVSCYNEPVAFKGLNSFIIINNN